METKQPSSVMRGGSETLKVRCLKCSRLTGTVSLVVRPFNTLCYDCWADLSPATTKEISGTEDAPIAKVTPGEVTAAEKLVALQLHKLGYLTTYQVARIITNNAPIIAALEQAIERDQETS